MQLCDLKTLARKSSLSLSTCRKLVKMGLPHYRIDRKILVDEDEAFDFFQRFKSTVEVAHVDLDRLIDQTLDEIETGAA